MTVFHDIIKTIASICTSLLSKHLYNVNTFNVIDSWENSKCQTIRQRQFSNIRETYPRKEIVTKHKLRASQQGLISCDHENLSPRGAKEGEKFSDSELTKSCTRQ